MKEIFGFLLLLLSFHCLTSMDQGLNLMNINMAPKIVAR